MCILQVDLDYPKYLHKIHEDLPFCVEHKVPPPNYHFTPHKNILANDLKLTKITKLRAQATTAFEINSYKLAITGIFGKTMEYLRKHRIV